MNRQTADGERLGCYSKMFGQVISLSLKGMRVVLEQKMGEA